MEVNQDKQSVLAKLMGLDELPPQQPLPSQQKVLSDEYLRKTASIGLLEKSSVCIGRLSKKTAEKQDKHLCGSSISMIDKQIPGSISCEKVNPSTLRGGFSLSRRRNSHSNCHSADKKLYHAKGFDNMLEDQNATGDDVKRFFRHSDLSTKWVGDSSATQLHLHPDQLSTSLSTSSSIDRDSEVCRKPNKMMTHWNVLRPVQKLENDQRESHISHLDKLMRPPLDLQDKSSYSFRRIVVLKPSSGKALNCARDFLPPASDVLSQAGSRQCKELGEIKPENEETNIRVPETSACTTDIDPPRHSFRVTRGVAKKTAQEVKQNTVCSPRVPSKSQILADESSADVSEALMVSSQRSFDCKRTDQMSIFTREAKKQIFERWKTTKNFQEAEGAYRRCTFGEMFSMHDGGAGPKTLYSKIEKHGSSCPLCLQGENSELGGPLNSGRKCGSKAEFIRNCWRSNHFENFSIACGSPNLKTISEPSQDGWCGRQQETVAEKSYKLKSKSFNKESLEPRDLRASCEKHHSADLMVNHNTNQSPVVCKLSVCNVPYSGSNVTPSLQFSLVIQHELEPNREKDICSEVEQSSRIVVRNMSSDGFASQNLLVDEKSEAKVSAEKQLSDFTPQRSLCLSSGGEISRCTNDSDLGMKLGEINQSSPDSVLYPPFPEENTISSECSNSPVPDLSGLGMKLQLLDSKSKETNSETPCIAVSSDQDSEKGSLNLSRNDKRMWRAFLSEESREFSYLIDVLDGACTCDGYLDLCFEKLHATEWPVSSALFETLEKKYGKKTSWLKSERRLLFDHINSTLREILDSFMAFQISAKPLKRRFNASLKRDEVEEELWTLLLSQKKEASKDLPEKVLGKEMKWFELEEDISIICIEIEEFLFNELAAELGSNECS